MVGVVATVRAGLSLPVLQLVSYVCQIGVLADIYWHCCGVNISLYRCTYPDPRMANRSTINAGRFYIIIIIIIIISKFKFLSLAITHTQMCILPLRRQVSDCITFLYFVCVMLPV